MAGNRKEKQVIVDETKVKRVQKILGAKTEAEAIEQALDMILANDKLDRSHENLVRSGIAIEDTLGRLAK